MILLNFARFPKDGYSSFDIFMNIVVAILLISAIICIGFFVSWIQKQE